MRAGIQMRPCTVTNDAEVVRRNAPFISINTAMGVDLFGNVRADYVDARRYYSGVGGQPDFVRALNDPAYGVPIITMKSRTAPEELFAALSSAEAPSIRVTPPGPVSREYLEEQAGGEGSAAEPERRLCRRRPGVVLSAIERSLFYLRTVFL